MNHVPPGHLYLGDEVDPATHERRTDAPIHLEAADLTTHGVIVGMTGSGKTGLGVVMIEEALLGGIPTLVIDPKGDMGNLLLTFPDLAPADFEPWIDAMAAERDGTAVADVARSTARAWREGLSDWGIDADRIERLRAAADVTIYTPGSAAGVPLNVIGSLSRPDTTDAEALADEVEGLATSLLALVGIDADPLSSREHILISNLVTLAWQSGKDTDLATLIEQIQRPPMRKLGVIELDSFFPPDDRVALALKLNGLMASPAFAAWNSGAALDVSELLGAGKDRPACAIVSIAHLNDDERQFVVGLVLSKLVTWMRAQAGTTSLRALVYMDEVFGFVPPTAMPPAKKPILTILKQARAFGVGMVLSTQNPVDLDYKAISNAGTWMIGRLQTERDKARLVEGMTSASGAVDVEAIDAAISGLDKREFVLHSTHQDHPRVFGTRWAMSYLAGPLTRDHIDRLMEPERAARTTPAAEPSAAPRARGDEGPVLADDETTSPPDIADTVRVAYLDPAAPWAAEIGADPDGKRLEAAVVARVDLLFDETRAELRHSTVWEAVLFPLDGEMPDVDAAVHVDYDERDLITTPPTGARYVLGPAKIHTKSYFEAVRRGLRDRLYRSESLHLHRNDEVGLYSRPDESLDDFADRCRREADRRADAETDKLRQTLEARIDRVHAAIAKAEDRVRETQARASSTRTDEILSGVGDVLGGLLGGRKSSRSILSGVRRAGSKRNAQQAASQRLETARNRLVEKMDDLEALEQELADSIEEIVDEWDAKAGNISEWEVTLEKNDISVGDLSLVWIPTPDR